MSTLGKEDTAEIAFNNGTIIYDPKLIVNIKEGSDFTRKSVPKTVVEILASLPSSDFYFGQGEKIISDLPGKPREYLKPTNPRSTIAKAIWKYRKEKTKTAA